MRCDSVITWRLVHALKRQGTLAKAALAESLDLSDASRRISALEKALGFSLLDRSVRPAAITENLKRLDVYAARIAKAARDIDALAAAIRSEAAGESARRVVRISLPVNLDKAALLNAFHSFEQRRPEVRIEFSADSGLPALAAGNTDISMGGYLVELPELFSLKVGDAYNFIMATRKYLARHGEPRTIEDLKDPQHRLLLRNHSNMFFSNRLENGTETFFLENQSNIFYGDASFCRDMLLAGEGLAIDLHIGFVSSHIADGTIVPVLPGWHRTPWNYYVYCRTADAADSVIRELMSMTVQTALGSISNQWRFWYRRLKLPMPLEQKRERQ